MEDDVHEFTGQGDDIVKDLRRNSDIIVTSVHELIFYSFVGRRIRDPRSTVSNQFLNIVDVLTVQLPESISAFTITLTVLHPNGEEEIIQIQDPFALFELQEVDDEGFVFDYWESHGVDIAEMYGQNAAHGSVDIGECDCDGCIEIRNILKDLPPPDDR